MHDMLNSLEYKKSYDTHDRVTDISNIIGALARENEEHPHEKDEDIKLREFYEGVMFLDDMNGLKELDKGEVIKCKKTRNILFQENGSVQESTPRKSRRDGM